MHLNKSKSPQVKKSKHDIPDPAAGCSSQRNKAEFDNARQSENEKEEHLIYQDRGLKTYMYFVPPEKNEPHSENEFLTKKDSDSLNDVREGASKNNSSSDNNNQVIESEFNKVNFWNYTGGPGNPDLARLLEETNNHLKVIEDTLSRLEEIINSLGDSHGKYQ